MAIRHVCDFCNAPTNPGGLQVPAGIGMNLLPMVLRIKVQIEAIPPDRPSDIDLCLDCLQKIFTPRTA